MSMISTQGYPRGFFSPTQSLIYRRLEMNIRDKIKELEGKEEEGGINWSWVTFPSAEQGQLFIDYLNQNGYEHRGLYVSDSKHAEVRWR
jgi:hypothetical protein